jgi:hypothetical protein
MSRGGVCCGVCRCGLLELSGAEQRPSGCFFVAALFGAIAQPTSTTQEKTQHHRREDIGFYRFVPFSRPKVRGMAVFAASSFAFLFARRAR